MSASSTKYVVAMAPTGVRWAVWAKRPSGGVGVVSTHKTESAAKKMQARLSSAGESK
jgi:hypothetical protein